MDDTRFDALARAVGAVTTRRSALRGVAAGILGSVGLGGVLDDVAAQRQGSGYRRCGKQYAGCNQGRDCCAGLRCKTLRNPHAEAEFSGVCAYQGGCGRRNDFCKKNRDCCRKFRCRNRKCKRR
jgi:hypothetical protein